MSLFERLQKDMYAAMKSGEKQRTTTLRMALSRLKDKRIERREDLSEQEEVKIIQSLVRQQKESLTAFKAGNRADLMEKTQAELDILVPYLPQMMSENELRALVEEVIAETGASGMSDIGKVMPQVMQRSAGRADGKLAQNIVREKLG